MTTSNATTPPRLKRLSRLAEGALRRALRPSGTAPRIVHDAMRYAVFSSGKRFRPLLCLAACEAVGAPARRALPAACAIELIHTYSLVHDDLPAMDNAALRRGKPSCHRKFGEGHAILAGDALLTYAFELLGRPSTSPHRNGHDAASLGIIRAISQACGTGGLIGGQALDLEAMQHPRRVPASAWRQIARWKTGALITASVAAGGLAGQAAPKQLQRLRKYGHNIGLAFQLIDDVHDRDGLAGALGIASARRQALQLIAQAERVLRPFGRRADGLRDLAQWLAATA